MAQAGGHQLLLSEDKTRTTGRDARSTNITAGRAIAQAVRTTLGPKGMDKMLVDSDGNVVVTNDGVTILSEMDVEHPAANMIVEVAETQEDEVGDGTTSAVILAGELLKYAEDLLEQDIHPTTIAQGYRRASQEASELLEDSANEIDLDDTETLEQIASTVMTGKSAEDAKEYLAELVVRGVQRATEDGVVDRDRLVVEPRVGRPVEESELIDGVVIEEDGVHPSMPYSVSDATIAVIDRGIEIDEPEIDAEITVDEADALREFQRAENEALREQVDELVDLGVDVAVTGKGIADIAAEYLASEGILAVEKADDEDLTRVARATGAIAATSVKALESEHLGGAEEITWTHYEDEDDEITVEGGEATEISTLLLRAGTDGALDEIERALIDSIDAVSAAVETGQVLPGGGAGETGLALQLRDFADSVGGREQLAVDAFADALEAIPRTLAENAGQDPIDALVDLRAQHSQGNANAGLDAVTGSTQDMLAAGVVEPLPVKQQAVGSATEAAVMILRIDDVISAD